MKEVMDAYDTGFSADETEEAKKRYAEVEKIRVEKFQRLYDFLCNKPYYTGSKYLDRLRRISLHCRDSSVNSF
jgi:hypothetical protein